MKGNFQYATLWLEEISEIFPCSQICFFHPCSSALPLLFAADT